MQQYWSLAQGFHGVKLVAAGLKSTKTVSDKHTELKHERLRMLLAVEDRTAKDGSCRAKRGEPCALCATWARRLCMTWGVRAVAHSANVLAKG